MLDFIVGVIAGAFGIVVVTFVVMSLICISESDENENSCDR